VGAALSSNETLTVTDQPVRAFVYGVIGGGLVVLAGSVILWLGRLSVFADLVWVGLSILVAPAAAASSATARGASRQRAFGLAGLAFLIAFFVVSVADYGLTVLLLMPDAPGPYQGKGDSTLDAVETWLLGRHIVLGTLGVLGGSALGMWRAER
jgi:hypothetical protein